MYEALIIDNNEIEKKILKELFQKEVVFSDIKNLEELQSYFAQSSSLNTLDFVVLDRKTADAMQNELLEVKKLKTSLIDVLAESIECRDQETGDHIQRTAKIMKILINQAKKESKYKDELKTIEPDVVAQASKLHDIGKIGITDLILNKPGRLTDREFEIVKQHVIIGEYLIDRIIRFSGENDFLTIAKWIILEHHEWWNGNGYPRGLRGININLIARFMAIADVYDALMTKRVYKVAMSHLQAVDIIKRNSGVQFDPELVDIFLSVEKKLEDYIIYT